MNLPQNWDKFSVNLILTLVPGGWLNTCFGKSVVWKGNTHSFSLQGLLMVMGTAISIAHFQAAAFFAITRAI